MDVWPDLGAGADGRLPFQVDVGIDRGPGGNRDPGVDVDPVGIHHGDAILHELEVDAAAQLGAGRGQLGVGVHPEGLRLVGGDGPDVGSCGGEEPNHVGEVVLTLGVLVAQPGQGRVELIPFEGIDRSIDLVDGTLFW